MDGSYGEILEVSAVGPCRQVVRLWQVVVLAPGMLEGRGCVGAIRTLAPGGGFSPPPGSAGHTQAELLRLFSQ